MRSNRRLGIAMCLALGSASFVACKKDPPPAPKPAVTPDKPKSAVLTPGSLVSLPASTLISFDLNFGPLMKMPAIQQLRTFLGTQEKIKADLDKLKADCGFDPLDRLTAIEIGALPPAGPKARPEPAIVIHGTWTKDEAKKCLTAMLTEENTLTELPAVESMSVLGVKKKPRPAMPLMPVLDAQSLAALGDAGANAAAALEQMRALAGDAGVAVPGMAADAEPEDTRNRRVAFGDGIAVFTAEGPLADAVAVLLKKKPGAESNAELVAARSAIGADPFMAFTIDVKSAAKSFPEQWQSVEEKVKSDRTLSQFASVITGLGTVSFGGRMDATGAMHGSIVFRTGSEADAKKAFEALDGFWKVFKVMARGKIPELRTKAEAQLLEMETKMPAAKAQIDSIRKFLPMLEGLLDKISVKQEGNAVRVDADFSADETNGLFTTFTAGMITAITARAMTPPPVVEMAIPDAGMMVAESGDAGAAEENAEAGTPEATEASDGDAAAQASDDDEAADAAAEAPAHGPGHAH